MYNRYIRNEHGEYTRVPEAPPSHDLPHSEESPSSQPKHKTTPTPTSSPPKQEKVRTSDSLTNLLQHFLDRLHLDHVDTGDLMLLALLFFLFQEKADEELLIALGLLLIL